MEEERLGSRSENRGNIHISKKNEEGGMSLVMIIVHVM